MRLSEPAQTRIFKKHPKECCAVEPSLNVGQLAAWLTKTVASRPKPVVCPTEFVATEQSALSYMTADVEGERMTAIDPDCIGSPSEFLRWEARSQVW